MKYLVIIMALGLTACSPSGPSAQTPAIAKTLNQGTGESDLVRYEDNELGVVCYRVRNYEGVSCIKRDLVTKPVTEQ